MEGEFSIEEVKNNLIAIDILLVDTSSLKKKSASDKKRLHIDDLFRALINHVEIHENKNTKIPLIFPSLKSTFDDEFIVKILRISRIFYNDPRPSTERRKQIQLGLLNFISPRYHTEFYITEGDDTDEFKKRLLKLIDKTFRIFFSIFTNGTFLVKCKYIKNNRFLDFLELLTFWSYKTTEWFKELNSNQLNTLRLKIAEMAMQPNAPTILHELTLISKSWYDAKLSLEQSLHS